MCGARARRGVGPSADSAPPLESPWSFGAISTRTHVFVKSNHGFGGNSSISLCRYSGTNGRTRFRLVLGIGTSARLLGGAVGLGHDLWIGDRDGEQADVGPRRAQTSSLRVSGTKIQAGVATAPQVDP